MGHAPVAPGTHGTTPAGTNKGLNVQTSVTTEDNSLGRVSAHRFALFLVFGGLSAIEKRTALHHYDVPLCVKALPGPGSHLTLGTRSDNMADRAMKGRHSTISTLRWRGLTRAQKAARPKMLRGQLKHKGWDPAVIRELVHGIDPTHPTLF